MPRTSFFPFFYDSLNIRDVLLIFIPPAPPPSYWNALKLLWLTRRWPFRVIPVDPLGLLAPRLIRGILNIALFLACWSIINFFTAMCGGSRESIILDFGRLKLVEVVFYASFIISLEAFKRSNWGRYMLFAPIPSWIYYCRLAILLLKIFTIFEGSPASFW